MKEDYQVEFCPDHPQNLVRQHLDQSQEVVAFSDEDYDQEEEEKCNEFSNPYYMSDDDDDEGLVLTYCQCPCSCCKYVYDFDVGYPIQVMK